MVGILLILQLLIFGYAINYDVKHLTTVVLDESRRTRAASWSQDGRVRLLLVVGRVDSFDELASNGRLRRRRPSDSSSITTSARTRHRGAAGAGAADRECVRFDDLQSGDVDPSASGNGLSVAPRAAPADWHQLVAMPIDLRVRPWDNPR